MPQHFKLSSYVLTHNSQKYLDKVLQAMKQCTDEILIIDSGSTDDTEKIARSHGARFIYRKFDNFRDQRQFALDSCTYPYVLMIDSDEVMDEELISSVNQLRETGFNYDVYDIRRKWFVMGREVHAMYPIRCPDTVSRLINTQKISFRESPVVHEHINRSENSTILNGHILHYTFETEEEYQRKIEMYGRLGAKDFFDKGIRPSFIRKYLFPLALFTKWYLLEGSWKDGRVGFKNSLFVYRIVRYKYRVMQNLVAEKKLATS